MTGSGRRGRAVALSLGVGLLAAGLLPAAPSPAAPGATAPTTCHGLPVRVTGTPGKPLVGTDGADVITSDGASSVDARGGDDTVCVTGDVYATVNAGSGDDLVDTTGFGSDTSAIGEVVLGAGRDVFLGGVGADEVWAGPADDDYTGPRDPDDGTPDTDVDTVSTGGGRDTVHSGAAGLPDADVIDLGPGRDDASLAGHPAGGSVSGGAGTDTAVWYADSGRAWTIDDAHGSVRTGSGSDPIDGLERHVVGGLSWSSLTIVGGEADEDVDLVPVPGAGPEGPTTVRLGGGDDRVQVAPSTRARLIGGRGRDEVKVFGSARASSYTGRVRVDLARGRYRIAGHRAVSVRGFEDATTWWFADALLEGDAHANRLTALGCRVTLHGGAGDDRLAQQWDGSCAHRPFFAHEDGGPGDDVLHGGPWADVLLGGPGDDTAVGSDGRDRCVAERRVSC